jgi:hypothetical protein
LASASRVAKSTFSTESADSRQRQLSDLSICLDFDGQGRRRQREIARIDAYRRARQASSRRT